MRFHFHRDPNWKQVGSFGYYECHCGARRIRRVSFRLYSAVPPAFELVDGHGRPKNDTGWF